MATRAARFQLRFILLCTLALLACSGDTLPGPARAIRLTDAPGALEVSWPLGADTGPSEALAAPRIGNLLPPGRVARVVMARRDPGASATAPRSRRESRLALLAPSGARYRFALTLPARPLLLFGLGFVPPDRDGGGAVRFEVSVEKPGGERATLLERALPLRRDGSWEDHELDLTRWARQKIVLELATTAADGGDAAWAAWAAPEIVSRGGREPGWDVVLIILDTLRADRLGCYGYQRPTSPVLDALAARAVRFATAVSQSPWTRPAHRSLFTGLYPSAAARRAPTWLAERLWQEGYRTEALTGGGQVDHRLGFARGFDAYAVADWLRHPQLAVDRLQRWRSRRRFLFLHTYAIHDPYLDDRFTEGLAPGRIPVPFGTSAWKRLRAAGLTEEEQRFVQALYDGGVAFADARLGELFAAFRRLDLFDTAIIVVTSDHGEQFWEHGDWRHGQHLYDHQLLVPLIVHLPPALRRELGPGALPPGAVVQTQVQLVDLYPTLLELLAVNRREAVDGRSLVPLLRGGALAEVPAFAEHTAWTPFQRQGVRFRELKYIRSIPAGGPGSPPESVELYDLRRDPGEQLNLAPQRPDLAAELAARLERLGPPGVTASEPIDLDPELRSQLEALGYAGDGP